MNTKKLSQLINELDEQGIESVTLDDVEKLFIEKEIDWISEAMNRDSDKGLLSSDWTNIPIGKLKLKNYVKINDRFYMKDETVRVRLDNGQTKSVLAKDVPYMEDIILEIDVDDSPAIFDTSSKEDTITLPLSERDRKNSNILVVGSSGSGKTVFIKNIIDHISNSNNEIYIMDLKGVDYTGYNERAKVLTTLKDVSSCVDKILYRLKRRAELASDLMLSESFTNNSFTLDSSKIIANDICFNKNDKINLMKDDGLIIVNASELSEYDGKDYKIVIHTCSNDYRITEDLKLESMEKDGETIVCFPEIFLIFDEFSLVNPLKPNAEDNKLKNNILDKLDEILTLSRKLGVTVIISSLSASSVVIPYNIKEKINNVFICGGGASIADIKLATGTINYPSSVKLNQIYYVDKTYQRHGMLEALGPNESKC